MRNFRSSRFFLPMLAFAAVLLRFLFQAFPESAQTWYRNGFYQGFRWIWDKAISSWLPFPAILLALAIYVTWLIKRGRKIRSMQRSRWLLLPDGLAVIVLWFLISWGYNYDCPDLTDHFEGQLISLESAEFQSLFERAHVEVTDLRDGFPAGLRKEHLPSNIQQRFRTQQKAYLASHGWRTLGEVRVREIKPEGLLHRLSISGIYLPFAGEGHAESGEALVPRLFTIAHEMSHGYGVTDEGEANYMAFVTLTTSNDPAFQYAGWLQLMRYSLASLKGWDYDAYQVAKSSISESLQIELDEIRAQQQRFEPWFPQFSETMNDFYLKQQGVEEGVDSYDGWLRLVFAQLDM